LDGHAIESHIILQINTTFSRSFTGLWLAEPNLKEYLACSVALVACTIFVLLAIGNVYRTEEFFIGEDMFVSLSKETA
jgi:hypothetical protein